jgi:hypothetical protein
MKAKVITQLEKCHLAEKSFVYITYGSREHDIFITKITKNALGEVIEFVGDNELKLPVGAEFFIGKANDKKLKMKVI